MKKNLFLGLLLFAIVSTCAFAQVTFSTFVSGANISAAEGGDNATIGFAYAGNKFVGSVFSANDGQLYQTDLTGNNVTTFGTPLPGLTSGVEVTLAASLNHGGFAAGNIYAGASNQGTIFQYSNSGGNPTVFATGLLGSVKSILFDPGSSFGGNMLVTTDSGNLYSITSGGVATLLTNIGNFVIEGMDILTSNWGPLAGDLVVASEATHSLYMIDQTNYSIVASLGTIPEAETVALVPLDLGASGNPVEGFYDANYPNDIQYAAPSDFTTLKGDIIATSEEGSLSEIWDIHYSGNAADPFSGGATQVGTLPNQSEDGIFVTAQRIAESTTPEPSSVVLLGTLMVGLVYLVRRKFRTT